MNVRRRAVDSTCIAYARCLWLGCDGGLSIGLEGAMRPPFFAFYPADFANDINVEAMCTRAVGAYILLLCKAWQSDPPGSLPNNDQILARLARLDAADWAEVSAGVLACFELRTDGRWHQPRLRREYDKALAAMKAKKDAGRKGGRRTQETLRLVQPAESQAVLEAVLEAPLERCFKQTPSTAKASASPISNLQSLPSQEEKNNTPSECSAGGAAADAKPPPEKKPARAKKPPDTAHHAAVSAFCEAWRGKYGAAYPFNGGKDGAAVKWLLAQVGGDGVKFAAVVARYLADGTPFVAESRHTIGLLRAQLPRWLAEDSHGGHGRPGGGVGQRGRAVAPAGKYDGLDGAPGLLRRGGAAVPGAGGGEGGAAGVVGDRPGAAGDTPGAPGGAGAVAALPLGSGRHGQDERGSRAA